MEQCTVWWIKRDARIADNLALNAAVLTGLPIVPVFVFEPSVIISPEYSSMHAHAQVSAVRALKADLKSIGSGCLIYFCECEEAFSDLAKLIAISSVFSQEETGPETTFARDRRMKIWFHENGIDWTEMGQGGVVRHSTSRAQQGVLRYAHYAALPISRPNSLPPLPSALAQLNNKAIPTLEELGFQPSRHSLQRLSEKDADSVLNSFLNERGKGYRYRISSPSTAFSSGSRLSAHLAWGTVSSRAIFHSISKAKPQFDRNQEREKDLRAFGSRLHWRDHFMQRFESAPWMEFKPLNSLYTNLPYRHDPEQYMEALLSGTTGFPMVDACMRCLSLTGFLNFRMRAMVTSFATHALRIDWKYLNAPLAARMYDYEAGIHISQIQMQAGVTGMNTLRVYSPAKQLTDQDSDLTFIRKWLPELAGISNEAIFAAGNGQIPGYFQPIINFDLETKLMKDALYLIKKSPANKIKVVSVVEKFGSRKRRAV